MVDVAHSVLTGIVQGLSEFLPISSSAHIVFTSSIYKLVTGNQIAEVTNEETFFNIMLHFGTLIAVLIYFRTMLWKITKEFFKSIKTRDFSSHEAKLGWYIILGTIFTILIAYPLKDICENLQANPQIVAILLTITGIILFLSEYVSSKFEAKTEKVGFKNAVIMGLIQGLAIFPGFSRSGWTIASGLFSGLNRKTATEFSFLLSIPIILGTSMLYPFLEVDLKEVINFNWFTITIGTIISAVVGYLCIKYFMIFVSKFSLKIFAYYCVILGTILTIFFHFV